MVHADVNRVDCEGVTPLCRAVLNNNIIHAKDLIKCGADVNYVEDHEYDPPLFSAVHRQQPLMVELLLQGGAEVTRNVRFWVTSYCALQSACNGTTIPLEIVQLLVRYGANIHAVTRGYSPLICAASSGNSAVALYLIEHGAEFVLPDHGYNAIACAWQAGHHELCHNMQLSITLRMRRRNAARIIAAAWKVRK